MEVLFIDFHPPAEVDWIFELSPLVDRKLNSDESVLIRVRKELSGFPTCKRCCTDAARFYRVLGVWQIPWTIAAAEPAFIAGWFALPAWRRRLLVYRYGFYALELHPDICVESLAQRDDAVLLAALLSSDAKDLDSASSPPLLLQFGAIKCLETLARKQGFFDGQWAYHMQPHLLAVGTQIEFGACACATDARMLEMLQLLQRHNCDLFPFAAAVVITLTHGGNHPTSLQFLCRVLIAVPEKVNGVYLCKSMAETGNLACLRILLAPPHQKRAGPWIVGAVGAAARAGRLDVVKYLHLEHGCRWNADTCASAAAGRRLECLEYLHDNGCPWDEWTCARAAEADSLQCLQYAHQNGCPMESYIVCRLAVQRDNLECLRYAHQNGCPFDPDTCAIAARINALKCLKYARSHDCPWDQNACLALAVSNQAKDVRSWIQEQQKK